MLRRHGEVDPAGRRRGRGARGRRPRRLLPAARALRGERPDPQCAVRDARRPAGARRARHPDPRAGRALDRPLRRAAARARAAPTPAGDLLASVPREGKVVLLERDADGDGHSDGTRTLLDGPEPPARHGPPRGLALRRARPTPSGACASTPRRAASPASFERIVTGLPGRRQPLDAHDPLRAGRLALRLGRLELQRLPRGGSAPRGAAALPPRRLRAARPTRPGCATRSASTGGPDTDELYATDNGRDLLGDDYPPCELNRVVKGGFYGWPFANGARDAGSRLRRGPRSARSPPRSRRPTRSAPTTRRSAWRSCSADSRRAAARDGDRGAPRLVEPHAQGRLQGRLAPLRARRRRSSERDFVYGLPRGRRRDRPAGRRRGQGADGAVYVSDDYAGAVYRIAAGAGSAAARPAGRRGAGGGARRGSARRDARRRARGGERARRGALRGERLLPLPRAGARRGRRGREAARGASRARYDVAALVALLAAPTPPMPLFPLSDARAARPRGPPARAR